ncbi:MAG: type II toxin-antitoxin system VapC family toxin [Verrucomicrobia bacterium]|nr:MAG: type II toxin-antitoxin system VapC family toxin [Verrucomicrobiota bacterium]
MTRLPAGLYRDPADRLIVATVRALALLLATHERKLRTSRLVPLWPA